MLIDSLVEMSTRVINIGGITPATFKFVNYGLFVDQRRLDFSIREPKGADLFDIQYDTKFVFNPIIW